MIFIKLLEKLYTNLSHPLIWGPDGITPLKNFKANSGGFTASCPNPAHEDKNPSFLMKEGLPVGKCQSCGYTLKWFDAVSSSLGYEDRVQGKDYWNVVNSLSKLNGGELFELTTEEKENLELIHEKQELKNTLSKYLHRQLLENPWAEYTRKYLEERGISREYLHKFPMLGYYPQTETVEQYLISEGFSLEAIQETSVLLKYFQSYCLIFSYKDHLGNTLGFKGRKPDPQNKHVRYQKGFKGELRHKSLLGLEACNITIKNSKRIMCVEGEFDWLTIQMETLKKYKGTSEFVCFGGSDIKPEALQTLKKAGAKTLYLSFDNDKAGKKATRDAIKYADELGLSSFVIDLGGENDPDDYINAKGLPSYQDKIKSASKASEWLGKEFLNKFTLNKSEDQERAKIDLLEEAKTYKGLLLDSFLEITTRALELDKNYVLELVKKQHKEEVKGIELLSLKSFLPDAPITEDFMIPTGWILEKNGLIRLKPSRNELQEIPVAAAPFFVSSRSVNIDTKKEKLEVSYLRDKQWKTAYEERSILLDHRKIVQLSDIGFPVTSLNCKDIVNFVSDFEGLNDEKLPKKTTISGFGWKKERDTLYFVMPEKAYGTDISIVFEPEGIGDKRLAKALRSEGSFKEWKKAIRRLIDHPRAMFHIYASLTPPLLELLDAPNFIIDNWGLTSIGVPRTF